MIIMRGRDKPLIVLAGGKGTRLRALDPTRPKPMVEVRDKPFLHWLIAHYHTQGYRHFLLSTGYLAEIIENYPWKREFADSAFSFQREEKPLGTGGAVRAIFESAPGMDSAWVINGDTLLPDALPRPPPEIEALFCALERGNVFDATPNLAVEGDFVVAESATGNYFDAGAVFVTRKAVERYRGVTPCSLHALLGPAMAARKVKVVVLPGTCYDIGTPERHKRFEDYLASRNG